MSEEKDKLNDKSFIKKKSIQSDSMYYNSISQEDKDEKSFSQTQNLQQKTEDETSQRKQEVLRKLQRSDPGSQPIILYLVSGLFLILVIVCCLRWGQFDTQNPLSFDQGLEKVQRQTAAQTETQTLSESNIFTVQTSKETSQGVINSLQQHISLNGGEHSLKDQSLIVNSLKLANKDKYTFSATIQQMLKFHKLEKVTFDLNEFEGQKERDQVQYKFKAAIQRLELVHNVDPKGKIKVEQTQFEPSQSDVKLKQERLERIVQDQRTYYEHFYNISRYNPFPHHFCVIVSSYNNAKSRLYLRNLDSIFMQNYQNYHIAYIDDASPDHTGEFVREYMQNHSKQIPAEKLKLIINPTNMKAMVNIYNGIHQHCSDEDIVMLLDGDDAFLGREVMSAFNAAYHRTKAAMVYSQFISVTDNSMISKGNSRAIPERLLGIKSRYRQIQTQYVSHLISFSAFAFKKIKKSDFTYTNGTFFNYAYDVAIGTPLIEMLGKRIHYMEHLMYECRFDTGTNDALVGQVQVDKLIYSKPPYKQLTNFEFINKFYRGIDYDRGIRT